MLQRLGYYNEQKGHCTLLIKVRERLGQTTKPNDFVKCIITNVKLKRIQYGPVILLATTFSKQYYATIPVNFEHIGYFYRQRLQKHSYISYGNNILNSQRLYKLLVTIKYNCLNCLNNSSRQPRKLPQFKVGSDYHNFELL